MAVLILLSLVTLGWAAVDAFGWLHGLGILAAVYLLMPPFPTGKPK